MSQYYAVMETVHGVKLKDVEAFKRDVALLDKMTDGHAFNGVYLDYHEEEPYVFVNADENGGLEVMIDDDMSWIDLLPPQGWPDERRAAHADAFGYLSDYADYFNDDFTELNLIPFLQNRMTDDCIAIIHSVSHERLTCWYWSVAFTSKEEVWKSLIDIQKELEEQLKQKLVEQNEMQRLSVQPALPRR